LKTVRLELRSSLKRVFSGMPFSIEINRKIVDHISDINMTYTEHARRYLLNEGIMPEKIIKTGIHFLKPLGFFDYVKLQMNAFCSV